MSPRVLPEGVKVYRCKECPHVCMNTIFHNHTCGKTGLQVALNWIPPECPFPEPGIEYVKEPEKNKIILNTSDEAAKFCIGFSGWVDRHGRFWGNDERIARWNGCTHTVCDCGKPVEKSWTLCEDCRDKAAVERYQKREKKAYDGSPVYSEKYNEYFLTLEDMDQYCYEHLGVNNTDDIKPEDLLLRSCDPVYAHEIDPENYYGSELPDDEDSLPKEVAEAFEELNTKLRSFQETGIILSWEPGKYAIVFD